MTSSHWGSRRVIQVDRDKPPELIWTWKRKKAPEEAGAEEEKKKGGKEQREGERSEEYGQGGVREDERGGERVVERMGEGGVGLELARRRRELIWQEEVGDGAEEEQGGEEQEGGSGRYRVQEKLNSKKSAKRRRVSVEPL